MKQRLPLIAAALSCVLAAACLFRISALNRRIDQLQSNLSSQISRVGSSVRDIASTVDNRLEQGVSLLAAKDFSYGDSDVQSGSVALRCSVTPKEHIPGETGATLYWSGGEAPMVLERGSFTATLALPLFSDSLIERVVFSEGGALRTEALDWSLSPRLEFLPQIYAFLSGTASGSNGSYRREATADLDIYSPAGTPCPESVTLIALLDGRETVRQTLVPESDGRDASDPNHYHASYAVDGTYAVPNGSIHELWLDVAGGDGLHYRLLVDRWITDAQGLGSPDENQWMWQGSEADIYDGEGNLLHKAEWPRQ